MPASKRPFLFVSRPFLALLVVVLFLADGRLPEPVNTSNVWVYFGARDLSGAYLVAALDQAEASLNPRTARRRAKMHRPGERLVNVQDLPLDGDRLAACLATGARLRHQSRWLNAASFAATPTEVARLQTLPGVLRVSPVRGMRHAAVPRPIGQPQPIVYAPLSEKAGPLDYGLNFAAMVQANVPAAHSMGLSGHGVVVGMLDAGFRTTHEALAVVPVLAEWDFVNGDGVVDNQPGDPAGSNSHGTMTMSTLAGYKPGRMIAPGYGVSLLLAKTEDISQEIPLEEDNWVAGLEWAEALGADIISSSLGYIDWYVYADLNGNTAVTTIAGDLAAARGLVVVNSAGNDRNASGHIIAPADGDSVIAVGAVDITGQTTSFSSPGPTFDGRIKPDVAALGQANTVASATDDTLYVAASGTSFSCPLTSGVVALMLERVPMLTPMQVREALRATGSQSAAPDNDQGWGIIDAAAAATWFGPVITHIPLTPTTPDPFTVYATVTDRIGLDPQSLVVWYRIDGGAWSSLPLVATGSPAGYAVAIPVPYQPAVVDYYLTAASLNGIATSFPYAGAAEPISYTVNGASPVDDSRLPAMTHLAANVPNPFNPRTTLSFTLATTGPTHLRIYDLSGRLVRTLLSDVLDAGTHEVLWDGRDDQGRAASSGAYFYRLGSAGEIRQRKMLLVR